jgi:DNA topoisomerase I
VPAETLLKRLHAIDERLAKAKLERTDKDENKTTALGTSKINYLDPRITVAWCKRHQVRDPLLSLCLRTRVLCAWMCACMSD